jgi:hypothetical protein
MAGQKPEVSARKLIVYGLTTRPVPANLITLPQKTEVGFDIPETERESAIMRYRRYFYACLSMGAL